MTDNENRRHRHQTTGGLIVTANAEYRYGKRGFGRLAPTFSRTPRATSTTLTERKKTMKRLISIILVVTLSALFGYAQQSAQSMHGHSMAATTAADYGKTEAELIKLDREWGTASARGDAKALDRLLASNYTFTDLDGRVGNKVELLRDLKSTSANRVEALEASDYKVQIYGNTAVMTHLTTATSGDSKVQLQSMHVWVKRGAAWQVVAHQWTAVSPRNSTVPDFRARCANYSYEPEVMAYFGDSGTIINKLDNDQMGLPDRRGYLLLVETKQTAEFSFFERVDAKDFRVSQWQGESLGDLREKLTDVILENRGIACVGEQTKMIVNAAFHPSDRGTIPMPLSAKAAFSHILKKYGKDDYLRVTILLLC